MQKGEKHLAGLDGTRLRLLLDEYGAAYPTRPARDADLGATHILSYRVYQARMTALHPSLLSVLSDRYRIERELGQGGMATVYLAEDRKHRRKVAIKVMRPELATHLGAERFLREIQITAKLQHPNILTLIDSGEAAGGQGASSPLLYYVMPYVEGESLRDRLVRERTLPPADAARILLDVLDALAYAHQRGVVHRDIKPENIMLTGRHALVMDFGVAKAAAAAATVDPVAGGTLTLLGLAIGTPAYMAPEQAAGQAAADGRVDLYAVGVTAYEMLSGAPPFTGSSPQAVLAAHLTQAPRPLQEHCPALPAAFAGAIMRCLAKDPALRWQSADELIAHLEPFTTPTAVPVVGPRKRLLPRPRRWLLVAPALGLLVLGWWFGPGRQAGERDRAANAEPVATPEAPDLAGAPVSLPPERLDPPAADTVASRLYLQGRALLARHREADTREALRLFETAVARDSTFALGYAGLAVAAAEMHLRFADPEDAPAWGERAIRAGRAALRLDQQRAEVHEALAAVHRKTEFDWEATIRESQRALALNPNLANAHFYLGGALFHLGLLEEAERVVLAGLRVQPPGDRVEGTRTLETVALAAGRYVEAIALFQDVQRLSDRPVADLWLAQAYFYAGNVALAERLAAALVARGSGASASRASAALASFLAYRGDRERAFELVRRAEGGLVDHHVAYSLGAAHAQLRQPGEAVRWLRTAVLTGFPCYPWFARDPLLDPIRGEAAFRALLTELKVAWQRERDRFAAGLP